MKTQNLIRIRPFDSHDLCRLILGRHLSIYLFRQTIDGSTPKGTVDSIQDRVQLHGIFRGLSLPAVGIPTKVNPQCARGLKCM